jgi:hypothetical protein
MATEDPYFRLRIPEALRAKVAKAAQVSSRSLTAEILHRLEASFEQDDLVFDLAHRLAKLEAAFAGLRDEVYFEFSGGTYRPASFTAGPTGRFAKLLAEELRQPAEPRPRPRSRVFVEDDPNDSTRKRVFIVEDEAGDTPSPNSLADQPRALDLGEATADDDSDEKE